MMTLKLGSEMQGASFAVKGQITSLRGAQLLKWVVDLIGMTSYGDPIVREWPGENGVGGHGLTIIQSLVESFAVIESWDDLNGFYLIINSCKPFDPYKVWGFLEVLGFIIVDGAGTHIRLIKRPSWIKRLLKWWGLNWNSS